MSIILKLCPLCYVSDTNVQYVVKSIGVDKPSTIVLPQEAHDWLLEGNGVLWPADGRMKHTTKVFQVKLAKLM